MWFTREDDECTMYLDIVFCRNCKYSNGVGHWCDMDIHVNDHDEYCSKGDELDGADSPVPGYRIKQERIEE